MTNFRHSTAALFSKLFFSLIDASMRPTAGPDALAVAADLCILTFAEIPDLLVDPRFQPLDVIDKLFASQSGVSHVVVEQLLRILANAYEKTGVSESRDRLHEFGAIIQRISKMKDVQPDISDILSRILMDAIKFQQDIPAWLRKAFAKYTDSGELDELDADDLLLSSKKQSRCELETFRLFWVDF